MSAQAQFDRYLRFLETDPENIHLLTDIANCAYDMRRFDDALEYASRGLNLEPGKPELRATKALATLAQGNPKEAQQLLQQLIEDGIAPLAIRYNLAYCLTLTNQYQAALELLPDAEDEWQNLPQMAHLKVKILHFQGEVEQAIALCKHILEHHQDDAILHGLLSALYIDEIDFEQAQQHAKSAIQNGNAIPEAYTSLGTLALSEQDDITALRHFEQAIQLKGNSGRAWLGKAMTEMLQNNLAPAQESFNTALRHMPRHLGTWQALAWCQIAQHDLNGAESTAQQVLALDDTFAESHGMLAIIAVMKGNLDLAQQSIRRALRLDRESFSGRYAQALLLRRQGQSDASQKLIDGMLDSPILPDQRSLRTVLIKHMGKTTEKHE